MCRNVVVQATVSQRYLKFAGMADSGTKISPSIKRRAVRVVET